MSSGATGCLSALMPPPTAAPHRVCAMNCRVKLLMLQRKDKLHTTALLSSAHYCLACFGGVCHKKQTTDLFSGMHSFEIHIVCHLHHVASVLVKTDR